MKARQGVTMIIKPHAGQSFEISDMLASRIYYLYTNQGEDKNAKELGLMFDLNSRQILDIVTTVHNQHKGLSQNLKQGTILDADIKELQVENIICASFANLTVGDCLCYDNRSISVGNQLFKFI